MHEWALAEAVIRRSIEYAGHEKLVRVSGVAVLLGELQSIDKEIFRFALAELVKNSFKSMSSCRFRLMAEPAAFKCRVCLKKFTLRALKKTGEEAENIHFIPEMAHAFLECPKCKSPDFEIMAGRGVSIKYIRGVK
jgi:hydrogenase nickel incorporation protein HypA/HybF